MANKTVEINLLGLGNNPSDYDCKDGNLALAVNVLHENGSIKNACYAAPKLLETLEGSYKVVYQHKILESGLQVIIEKNDSEQLRYHILGWDLNTKESITIGTGETVKNIISIGDTLIIYTNKMPYYYHWNVAQYDFIGNDLPEIEMTFGLQHHLYDYMKEATEGAEAYKNGWRIVVPDTDVQDSGIGGDSHIFNDDDVEKATEGVFGLINRFQGEWCYDKGYFSQPFLVRYALRLFDGSYTKHSAPILMVPATGTNPTLPIIRARHDPGTKDNYIDVNCVGIGSSLHYYLKDKDKLVNDWKDIVKGVDVFVSAPIYTYDSTEKVKRFTMPHWVDNTFHIDEQSNSVIMSTLEEYVDKERTFGTISDWQDKGNTMWGTYSPLKALDTITVLSLKDTVYSQTIITKPDNKDYLVVTINGTNYDFGLVDGHMYEVPATLNHFYPISYVHVPQKADGAFDKEVKECSNFYLAKSYDTQELVSGSTRTLVKIAKGTLGNIVTQYALDDDYDSHHSIMPNYVTTYNNRLNLANISKTFFKGFSPFSMFQRVGYNGDDDVTIKIYLKVNNQTTSVVCYSSDDFNIDDFSFPYIYYPDPNAFKAEVFTSSQKKYTFQMKEHTGLNGSIAYIGINAIRSGTLDSSTESAPDDTFTPYTLCMPNYVYTSEVNNPWKFKAANVERIGGGKIIAMSPTTLPLSQGQYGYAQMYCFTTDGIWALKVNNTGGWASQQPFHYDIILGENKDNVLRMERDVLFSTDRGLMILAGNSVECISEIFNGQKDGFLDGSAYSYQFGTSWFNALKNKIYPKVWKSTESLFKNFDYKNDFNEFIRNAVYLYDYRHQRIIVGNSNYTFSFVFSIEDKLWTAIPMKILSAVNSYPQCYANVYDEYNEKNLFVDFSDTAPVGGEATYMSQPHNGIILTRPIKLNSPSVQKTIRTINLHGKFDKDNTSIILLGCNDNAMKDWFIVSSCDGSRLPFRYGTPFKFFRVAIVTRLNKGESLSSMMIEYEYKELNKERQ